jgi:ectoine hydroxylase-related dioxygenase (phytanoyl-CoA dioxygenase family)
LFVDHRETAGRRPPFFFANMRLRLTPKQTGFYRDNGYLAVENVIPAGLIAAERERFDSLCEHWDGPEARRVGVQHEPGLPPERWSAKTVRKFTELMPHEPVFRAHALHPNLVDIVADLIGTPFSLFVDQALLKPPSVGSPKPAHQDNAYFKVRPHDAVITCWCAIDDATLENGCMRYLPGTHKLGLLDHKQIEGTPHLVPEGYDVSQAVPVPLRAGGVAFHHGLTLHLSLENRSATWRRSFICHYVRTDADFALTGKDPAKLLKVRD